MPPSKKQLLFNVLSSDKAAMQRISKRNNITTQTGVLRFALAYADAAQRSEPGPENYDDCDDDTLRSLIVHGANWSIRSTALDVLLERKGARK